MNLRDRIGYIDQTLDQLYPHPPVPLNHRDPYTLLIAVLLSAQCTDERVNKVTPALFDLADSPGKMAKRSVEQINAIVRPCGLAPRKAKAIKDLSILLNDRYQGEVPASFESLEELPGVGHKTASVVMAQAFGHPAFPVDTHIHRLAQRWKLTSGKNVVQTEKDLKRHFPKERWNDLHLQIIYFGREYCTARSCHGLGCIICRSCFPGRKSKIVTKKS
ncbi:MAG: endonuclease III [Opitutae bacterium]